VYSPTHALPLSETQQLASLSGHLTEATPHGEDCVRAIPRSGGRIPPKYLRDSIPALQQYPGGQSLPTLEALDFVPGELVGCVSGELGLRKFLEDAGHTLVVISDRDGDGSELDRELADADVVISQPFWPAYLTRERIAKTSPPVSQRCRRADCRVRDPMSASPIPCR
jgi:hypothetical protein